MMFKTVLLAGVCSLSLIATARSQSVEIFQQGLIARQGWETWFNGLQGDMRVGANYWASQRSLPHPDSCFGTDGMSLGDVTKGCLAAKAMLTPIDVRRKTEPDFRTGFNSYQAVSLPAPKPSDDEVDARAKKVQQPDAPSALKQLLATPNPVPVNNQPAPDDDPYSTANILKRGNAYSPPPPPPPEPQFVPPPNWCKPVFQIITKFGVRLPVVANYCACELASSLNKAGMYFKSPSYCTPSVEELTLQEKHDTACQLLNWNIDELNRQGVHMPRVNVCP